MAYDFGDTNIENIEAEIERLDRTGKVSPEVIAQMRRSASLIRTIMRHQAEHDRIEDEAHLQTASIEEIYAELMRA